jgi:NTP pyrophosphatase (non-canonical NTP hydrolase)
MEIETFKKQIAKIFLDLDNSPNKKPHTKQSTMIHLTEEIGEIARQITSEYHRPEKFDKENLGTELADAMVYIILLSELYKINISREMEEVINRLNTKIKEAKR